MAELKYKVGDRVRIKSLDWYNENKDEFDQVKCGNQIFTYPMTRLCGKTVTITCVNTKDCYYVISGDDGYESWTDEMIEGLVEEDNTDCEKCGLTRNSVRCLFMDNCPHNKQKNIIEIPEGYVLKDENGNVINATKIVLEKKEKEYPKTYEECCYVLGFENTGLVFEDDYRDINPPIEQWKRLGLLNQFNKLLICRDAYWKIAGEEMGLGKPWKPDWNTSEPKYVIACTSNGIEKQWETTYRKCFAFPTEEMRDAFKDNFDPDIEICKELL